MRVFLVWKRRYADVRAGTQAPPLRFRLGGLRVDGWFRLGGLRVNGYFVCVELCGKIWWRLVGAAPMCPPASPSKGAPIVKFPVHNACILVWKRRCANVRAGTQAPPLQFCLVDCVWVVLFVGWENGAHEPTPSVLYFCQPRVD